MATWDAALRSQTDLDQYGDNALGLFALALRFTIDDLHSVAANAITDGADDKKCDMVYIDTDDEVAVVAQCYRAQKEKQSAPSNKASDLNTAVAWILSRPLTDLPERLQPAANELRKALRDGTVTKIEFWYVHNCPESANVRAELESVESTAKAALDSMRTQKTVSVAALEIGSEALEEMYRETQSPILMTDAVEFSIGDGFQVAGPKWTAFVTTVSARQLRSLYKRHNKPDGNRLFSANIRDYLGARRADANINNGIRGTAEDNPGDFWVFNNGITGLVNDFHFDKANGVIKLTGLSIVNGAQTTGAIGSLKNAPDEAAKVPARFVKTSDRETIQSVVQYNNSQNKVTASDFRSTDKIQKRLASEMNFIPDAEYQGGRRGGTADIIQRRPNLLPSYTVGQAIAALHGDPSVAYNKKSEIWAADATYAKYFNEQTTASHVVFAYSLVRAIENRKLLLIDREKHANDLTALEKKELEFFRQRGAIYLYASAISASLETLLGRKVPSLFRVCFRPAVSPARAVGIWNPVLSAFASLSSHLVSAAKGGLTGEAVASAIDVFTSLVSATETANNKIYEDFRSHVSTSG